MDVLQLTQQLVAIPSESRFSNRRIADCIAEVLRTAGFEIEEVTYWEEEEEKVSLVAKKGRGSGGIAFLSHSDTVPGGNGWDPFQPQVVENRLVGRGSCDTKGPLAATIAATADLNAADLARPVMLVITSDEEDDLKGAKRVIAESQWLAESRPAYGVICEATKLQPVYAHKGVVNIHATAHGIAAHSSSGKGVSSNFKIAPFLAEMAELNQRLRQDKRFQNPEFDPPINGFNMVINDGPTAHNVTSAKTVCKICIRIMPDACLEEAVEIVLTRAATHGLDVMQRRLEPFYNSVNSLAVQAACRASGIDRPVNVSYGTEAAVYQHLLDAVVLGPGNIEQAHTQGEWIDIAQLRQAVDVYRRLACELCT